MEFFMEKFDDILNFLIGIVWHDSLCFVLLGVGLLFTILTRGVQFRMIPQMFRLLFKNKNKDTSADGKKGISNFEAFMITVGGRVGTGNIAGVATAIFAGGPGAIFWMWMTAIVGAASAFIECTLAQIYKERTPDGKYIGGLSYYAEKGLGIKWFGTFFAVIMVISNIFGNPCIQANTIADAVNTSLGVPTWVVGIAIAAIMAVIIFGGIQRTAEVASKLTPFMVILYFTLSLILIFANLSKLPGVVSLVFTSAFSTRSAFGGLLGSAMIWGVRRGAFSNEAGQGTGTAAAAAVDADNPCEQGLIQALSVYIDTLVVCSITAFSVLISDCYNVTDNAGGFLVENLPGVSDGIPYVQYAINTVLSFGAHLVTLLVIVFAFTSLMSYYLEAETCYIYMTDKYAKAHRKLAITLMRVFFTIMIFVSSSWPSMRVWNLTDFFGGLLAWAHLLLITALCGPAVKAIRDYDKQRKAGIEIPVFDPVALNIKNAGIWTEINKEKGRKRTID